jgi:CyaY protein
MGGGGRAGWRSGASGGSRRCLGCRQDQRTTLAASSQWREGDNGHGQQDPDPKAPDRRHYTRRGAVRHAASVPTTMTASAFTDAEYHERASAALASIESQIDRWLDEDLIDIDSHRTGGLLELALPNGSKLIINTQPPLHELWLAAKSGGYHFRLQPSGQWLDTKDGAEFFQRLSDETSAQSGKALTFAAPR